MTKLPELVKTCLNDLIYSIFPDLCIGCIKNSKTRSSLFCVECHHKMPFTDHFELEDNKLTQHFYGRIKLEHGAALLSFRNDNIVGNMVHGLKYKNRKETGHVLGILAGDKLKTSKLFNLPDLVIPVPLTKKKEAKRGYNQSAVFGNGVCESLNLRLSSNILFKITETASQTGKSRTDRVVNVSETFQVKNGDLLSGRHVLLLDDVVTTGATLEACCLKLLESGAAKISILTIASAE